MRNFDLISLNSPIQRVGLFKALLLLLPGLFCHQAMGATVAAQALKFDGSQTRNPQAEIHCLALNVYHEARGESDRGKYAVAVVTLNRVDSPRYPKSVCGVVWQRAQFSWTHDGRSDIPRNRKAWKKALRVATRAYLNNATSVVGEATHFHTVQVRPSWSRKQRKVCTIGRHIFYEPL